MSQIVKITAAKGFNKLTEAQVKSLLSEKWSPRKVADKLQSWGFITAHNREYVEDFLTLYRITVRETNTPGANQ
jgi:hypothetical protein